MYKGKKIGVIILARLASTRLPGKVLLSLNNKPVLQHIVERVQRCELVDDVIIATASNASCDPIEYFCFDHDYNLYRGSEEDILGRFTEAAEFYNLDICVRVTGDCPMVDWSHIDHLIRLHSQTDSDCSTNMIEKTFPRGCEIEVISIEALKEAEKMAEGVYRKHCVSYFCEQHPKEFSLTNWEAPSKLHHPEIRITLDTLEDYVFLYTLFSALGENNFTVEEVIEYLSVNEWMLEINKDIKQKAFEEG